MSRRKRITAYVLTCGLSLYRMGPADAVAQVPGALSDSASISLITVLPGDAVYSLFGHSALRVRDPDLEIDYSFSYGTFHFDDPLFVPRFIRGNLNYYLSVARFQNALRLYRDVERRPVIEQPLDLDRDQRDSLYAFLVENWQPENRYYRYDFLFDNCSTRIRDALETVFEDEISFEDSLPPGMTFRQLLAPYLGERPFLRLGIDLQLGARVDRPASPREQTFLPDYLSASFDAGTLTDSDGTTRPLVTGRDTILWVSAYQRPERSTPWAGITLVAASVLIAVVTLVEARRGRHLEIIDTVMFGFVGLLGCFLLFMWFGTAHHVTAANWNLAWAWPTHFVFAAVLARRGLSRYTVAYATASALGMVVLVVAWGLIPQDLPEPALAIVLMVAARGIWITQYARASENRTLDGPAT